MTKTVLYWHVHHTTLIEVQLYPIRERINYIKENKPTKEIDLRVRLLKRVKGKLPKELMTLATELRKNHQFLSEWHDALIKYKTAINALHKKECKKCPWNGETIFPWGWNFMKILVNNAITPAVNKVLDTLLGMEIPDRYEDLPEKFGTINIYPYYRRLDLHDDPGPKEYGWSVVRDVDRAEHNRGVTFYQSPFTNLIIVCYNTDPQYDAFNPFFEPKSIERIQFIVGKEKEIAQDIYAYLFRECITS